LGFRLVDGWQFLSTTFIRGFVFSDSHNEAEADRGGFIASGRADG